MPDTFEGYRRDSGFATDFCFDQTKGKPFFRQSDWKASAVLLSIPSIILTVPPLLVSGTSAFQTLLVVWMFGVGLAAAALAWHLYRQGGALHNGGVCPQVDDRHLDLAVNWRSYYDCNADKHPCRVVLVTRDPVQSRALVDSLCGRGHHVFHAPLGTEMIARMREQSESWDMVILGADVAPCSEAGVNILRAIRAHCPGLPVLQI